MKINCIAVDDDPYGLEMLSDYMLSLPNYNLVNSFTDPLKALSTLQKSNAVDVLFMDVEMPGMNGIELSRIVKHKTKKLVLTTAHAKYALDAFDINADAFLLKPYSLSKFALTLDKLFTDNSGPELHNDGNRDFFFIKSKDEKFKLVKVYLDDVIAIESIQNNISIYTFKKTITASLTLTKIKETFQNMDNFVQVHRSFIISKKYIEEIEGHTIKMSGNYHVTLGDNYRDDLLMYIKENTIKTGRG